MSTPSVERSIAEKISALMDRADAKTVGVRQEIDELWQRARRLGLEGLVQSLLRTVTPTQAEGATMHFGEVDGRLAQTSVWPDGRAKQWLCDSSGNQEDAREGRWDAESKTIETADGERYGVNGMRRA